MSEYGDSTPSMNKLPGRNNTWTLPVTRSCDESSSASMSRHTGSSSWPSCTQSPYGPRERFLDALLARREHELLELAMRGEQRFGGRRFERHAALGADDGVAQVDAAADAVRRAERFELLDHFDGATSSCRRCRPGGPSRSGWCASPARADS